MATVMKALTDMRRSFSNRREWREFASAVQCSITSSAFAEALKASTRASSPFWRWVDPRVSNGAGASIRCSETGAESLST